MDKILHFNFLAVIIFSIILFVIFVRKTTKGISNKVFLLLLTVSLLAALSDLGMELISLQVPLSRPEVIFTKLLTYIYFTCRSAMPLIYMLFIFALTRTWYLLKKPLINISVAAPYIFVIFLLSINMPTGKIFTVTPVLGYQRGPWISLFYLVAVLYSIGNICYLIYSTRVLKLSQTLPLISMNVTSMAALIVQFLYPGYLVEMIITALVTLFIVMMVIKPEDIMDSMIDMPSFRAYQIELRKMLKSKNKEQIIVIKFINAAEVRKYLYEKRYLEYIGNIISIIEAECKAAGFYYEMYLEHPGSIYIMLSDWKYELSDFIYNIYDRILEGVSDTYRVGARLIPRICSIQYPQDLSDYNAIINIGHQFDLMSPYDSFYIKASEIINSKNFLIENNMDRILNKAIFEKKFEMYYQPIYSTAKDSFTSAEALIRLNDEDYGFISPAIFIPAAERRGLMVSIGDAVLELVFKFIGENDLKALGLDYIELNLSIAQCLQEDLAEKILKLQEIYNVKPCQVNLEVTETTYENIGEVMNDNINELFKNGYSFSLDDYGTGYSNIHRIMQLPLKIIKIDKSLVDEMFRSENGMSIMKNTVQMMKDINKELVVEGVETQETVDTLMEMGCDYIQGYYFSKPLPKDQFIEFLKRHNC